MPTVFPNYPLVVIDSPIAHAIKSSSANLYWGKPSSYEVVLGTGPGQGIVFLWDYIENEVSDITVHFMSGGLANRRTFYNNDNHFSVSLKEGVLTVTIRDLEILPNNNIISTAPTKTGIFGPQGLLAAPDLYRGWPDGPEIGMLFRGKTDGYINSMSMCGGICVQQDKIYRVYHIHSFLSSDGNAAFSIDIHNPQTSSDYISWGCEWDDIFKAHFEFMGYVEESKVEAAVPL